MSNMGGDDCCKVCRFWRPGIRDTGYCHRRAPIAQMYSQLENYIAEIGYKICGPLPNTDWGKHETSDAEFSVWPATDGDEWCGDFEARHILSEQGETG